MRKLPPEERKQRFDLRLKPELAKTVRKKAKQDKTSVTDIVESAIEEYVK